MVSSTTPKRSQRDRWPLESFGPKWTELWLRASREPFSITFKTRRDLNAFRLRAQVYRNLMKHENRNGWKLLYRATTQVDGPGSLTLNFNPVEAMPDTYFAQVGIVDEEILPADLEDITAGELMKELLKEKGL